MKCLLTGAGLSNKGSYLMLLAAKHQIEDRYKDTDIFVSPLTGNRKEVLGRGFRVLRFPLLNCGTRLAFRTSIVMGQILTRLRVNGINWDAVAEMDVIFDISGYGLSEQLGARTLVSLDFLIRQVKKTDTKYILAPQAFGPFQSERVKATMRGILRNADLVFARDRQSYDYLMELDESKHRVHRCGDITLAFHPETNNPVKVDRYCCIVPNERMLDQGRRVWGQAYTEILRNVVGRLLESTDLQVVLLVHDQGGKDFQIAQDLHPHFTKSGRVQITTQADPLVIKTIIAKSDFTIGSRYHALASALSSNVPCIGLGWTHKYRMLFLDYGIGNLAVDSPDMFRLDLLDNVIHSQKRERIRNTLLRANVEMSRQNDEMWTEVDKILRPCH